jgi:hypothetical protein
VRVFAFAMLVAALVCAPAVRAAGGAAGAPVAPLPALVPGLSQRCLDRIDPGLQGAAAARALHECRKPQGPGSAAPPAAQPAAGGHPSGVAGTVAPPPD